MADDKLPYDWGKPTKLWSALMEAWTLPVDLMGGTTAMRKNADLWLPKFPKEQADDWGVRVRCSYLYNSFKRTVRVLSSKPFKDPVKILEQPAQLEDLEYDIDRKKKTLTQFCRERLSDRLQFGVTHWIVDMPSFRTAGEEGDRRLTLKQQRDLNIHPYFCAVKPTELIYWSYIEGYDGEEILEEIRIKTCYTDKNDDEWEVVTVWTRDAIDRYKRKKNAKREDSWIEVFRAPNELGYIPLVSCGPLEASSPLDDLAQLNLRHYRSQSDQDTCLHFARVPFLHFAGFDPDEVYKTVKVSNAYVSKKTEASISWVETEGDSLEAGSKDLEQIEARMDVMGADLMVQKPGNPTATAKSIDTAEKVSDLQAIVMELEGCVERAYEIAGDWINVDASDMDVQLDVNFGLTLNDASEIDFLLKARIAGEISRELFYEEIQRRGLFEEFDIKKEMARVALEAKQDQTNESKLAPTPAST
jgi:hypothetical protein